MSSHEIISTKLPHPSRFALLRSFIAIVRDPQQTSHGARLVMAIDRHQMEQAFLEFAENEEGARILEGEPTLYELLTDRASLEALPQGSLGRTYLTFMEAEGISTEALEREVAPVEYEVLRPDPPRRRYHQHMRASHDLWHVLTGYHRDILGELQLLLFSHEQTGSRAFGWLGCIARIGPIGRVPGALALLELAKHRGKQANRLATAGWRRLLATPIDEARNELGISEPPTYTRYVRAPSGFGLVPEESVS